MTTMATLASLKPKPLLLIILDGWGYSPTTTANAIATAATPCWDQLWQTQPRALLTASGTQVGLPPSQMGNSEVGHMHIGAGRIIYQDLTRINMAIAAGSFFTNPVLNNIVSHNKQQLHILGLLSPGGVHSHENHIHALLELIAQHKHHDKVYLHLFLDGRDTSPRSAAPSLATLLAKIQQCTCGKVASIIGRYYAMDRNQNWERTQKAYNLLVYRQANYCAPDALSALHAAYERGENDEFIAATICGDPQAGAIKHNDAVIFMNFRADRARQLSTALTASNFSHFAPTAPLQLTFASLTEYDTKIPAMVAFPTLKITNTLAAILSNHGLTQLRIAESEKYAHVTYFFNSGGEAPLPGETRIVIPSPQLPSYDLKPEMSAFTLTTQLINAIMQQQYDVIICNYANADMVGHTGNFKATVQAIASLDKCLARLLTTLSTVAGAAIITADHGNAEQMFNHGSQQAHTAHTSSLVPAIYFGPPIKHYKTTGTLADIAPTMLHLLGLNIPAEMTGEILFTARS